MLVNQKLELYDRLYNHADKLLKKYNPCRIKNGKCANGRFCCYGCKYLNKSGCTVKCLECKLWLCSYLVSLPKWQSLTSKLNKMMTIAFKNELLLFRGSKKDLENYLRKN